MTKTSFFKRRWKLLLNLITILALIILGYAIRSQLVETIKNLTKVNGIAIFLMIPFEAWNYYAQARLFQSIFKILGNTLGLKRLYILMLELNLVNNVFPTGGVSGASYFTARARTDDISAGRASFAFVMRLFMVFFSFQVLLIIGLIMLAVVGNVNNIVIFVATFSSAFLLVGTIVFIYIVRSQYRTDATLTYITKMINRVIHVFRRKHPETIQLPRMKEVFIDFHENYKLLESKYKELTAPFLYGMLSNITEMLTIYTVFVAFGRWVNPGAVILAYAVANFAGLIAILPGGVGVYEAIMIGVMVAAGVPARLSLTATVMYRVVNTIIQLPPGYYFYHRSLRNKREAAIDG